MDAEVVVEHAACGDGGCELVADNVNWGSGSPWSYDDADVDADAEDIEGKW